MKNIVCILFLALTSCFVEVKECEYNCNDSFEEESNKDPSSEVDKKDNIQNANVANSTEHNEICGYEDFCYFRPSTIKDSPRPESRSKIKVLEINNERFNSKR